MKTKQIPFILFLFLFLVINSYFLFDLQDIIDYRNILTHVPIKNLDVDSTNNEFTTALQTNFTTMTRTNFLETRPVIEMNANLDEEFYRLSHEKRLVVLELQMKDYLEQQLTCATKFISTGFFCDASPGNGWKTLVQNLIIGFILNRVPLISIHRMDRCISHFAEFKSHALVYKYGSKYDTMLKTRANCPNLKLSEDTWYLFNGKSVACRDFKKKNETVLRTAKWSNNLHMLQMNPSLSDDQLVRARRIFSLGLFSSAGMLLNSIVDISSKIKYQFHQADYRIVDPLVLNMLSDPRVLKVGIHVRHLPFIVRDEGGHHSIDKRGRKCFDKAMKQEFTSSKYPKGCLLLVATDMKAERASLAASFYSNPPCHTYVMHRTFFNDSAEWGSDAIGDWENRQALTDRREVLEAYIDMYLLSEFANFIIIGHGSTFSNLIAMRNAGKPSFRKFFEFQAASCKEEYFSFTCCQAREAWNDVAIVQDRNYFRICEP